MRAKTVTLYSLPCVVAIAGLLVGAHEAAPLVSPVAVSAAGEHYTGQTVNRASKGDRLPVLHSPKARIERSPGRDVVVDPKTA
ncbi:MAG TPA: hypothetical protein VJ800_02950 [Pseudolabrys sp.]|nr:hypothetical protein [Pseudolabrys sp.]